MIRAFNPEGPGQLTRALDSLGVDEGWRLRFDLRPGRSGSERLWSEDRTLRGRTLRLRGR